VGGIGETTERRAGKVKGGSKAKDGYLPEGEGEGGINLAQMALSEVLYEND